MTMNNKVVLLDLERNIPTVKFYRDILEHYATLYIFSRENKFEFPLTDLTEFSSWVSSGQIVILDTLQAKEQEYEYAVVVGQLLALIEPESLVEVVSAASGSQILADMLVASGFPCRLIQVETEKNTTIAKKGLPPLHTILANPDLQLIKKYCDVIAIASGKPSSMAKLKNSIMNILQVDVAKTKQLIGMLINLKIVKSEDDQISFRKKILKQWQQIDLDQSDADQQNHSILGSSKLAEVDALLSKLQINPAQMIEELAQLQQSDVVNDVQSDLHKNFEKIDPVQMEVIRKLNQMKSGKPKDIYALRDLLEQLFPKSDVRLLLKEMIDKGYIYWNGHDVIYSHEMFLN